MFQQLLAIKDFHNLFNHLIHKTMTYQILTIYQASTTNLYHHNSYQNYLSLTSGLVGLVEVNASWSGHPR